MSEHRSGLLPFMQFWGDMYSGGHSTEPLSYPFTLFLSHTVPLNRMRQLPACPAVPVSFKETIQGKSDVRG